MTTRGFGHVYLETHDWSRSLAFWQSLGFALEVATDHGSGALVAPNGTRIFLAEQSAEDPVGMTLYLDAPSAVPAPPGVEVVFDWTPTHWGTRVMAVRDPDGRLLRLETAAADEDAPTV